MARRIWGSFSLPPGYTPYKKPKRPPRPSPKPSVTIPRVATSPKPLPLTFQYGNRLEKVTVDHNIWCYGTDVRPGTSTNADMLYGEVRDLCHALNSAARESHPTLASDTVRRRLAIVFGLLAKSTPQSQIQAKLLLYRAAEDIHMDEPISMEDVNAHPWCRLLEALSESHIVDTLRERQTRVARQARKVGPEEMDKFCSDALRLCGIALGLEFPAAEPAKSVVEKLGPVSRAGRSGVSREEPEVS